MKYAYPANLATDDQPILVTFDDVPEALTEGDIEFEALSEASDALAVALSGYVHEGRNIPRPSPARGRPLVPVPALVAAKLALYQAMQEQGITKVDLANRLGVTEAVARRLVNPDHHSRIEKVQEALSALGRRLVVESAA